MHVTSMAVNNTRSNTTNSHSCDREAPKTNMVHSRPDDISRRRNSSTSVMAASIVVFVMTLTLAATSPSIGCYAFAPPAAPTLKPSPHINGNGALVSSSQRIPQCNFNQNSIHRHRTSNNDGRCTTSPTSPTSLSMGIRSFIKRKILRRGDNGEEDIDNDTDEDAVDVSLHSILQSPGSAGLMDSPFTDSQYDITEDMNALLSDSKNKSRASKSKQAKKYVNEILGNGSNGNTNTNTNNIEMDQQMYEDTQERISRMKGGGMTEEEKLTFLNNALTRTIPKDKPRGPPIRQIIPGLEDPSGNKVGGKTKGGSMKSTGGRDGKKEGGSGGGDISVASLMMDGKMKDEEAKRKYMESITNPDRFATFSTYQQSVPAGSDDDDDDDEEGEYEEDLRYEEEEAGVDEVEGAAKTDDGVEEDFAEMKRQIAEDRALLSPDKGTKEKNSARDAVESILSMISSNDDKKKIEADTTGTDASKEKKKKKKKSTDHLAARLGHAAEQQERRDKEARHAAEEEAAKKREEERRKRKEVQMQREEEHRRKEEERIAKARRAAEAQQKQEEEKKAAAQAELDARQAAQDEYWAKMLEKEESRKERMEPVEIKRKKEVIARDSQERVERDIAKDVQRDRLREEERAREDPHESEILKEAAEAKLRDRERVQAIEDQAAARISRTAPRASKADASASAFVREQKRKKEEIDRLRKLDQQSLKSLNSPLPTPGKAPVGIPPSPYLRPSPVVSPPPPAPVPAARTPPSTPALSLASLTMAKKKEDARNAPPPPPPAPSQRLNLFEMTKLKDKDSSAPAPASSAAKSSWLPPPVKTKPAPASSAAKSSWLPPPVKTKPAKRVVRQQVSVPRNNDYNEYEEDDDNLMTSGAPGLTVADALKQQRKKGGGNASGGKKNLSSDDKAKQWGIDISKFT